MEFCRRLLFLFLFLTVSADASSDLPTTGYSLFDRLFSKPTSTGGYIYDIPFPFEKLLAELERRVPVFDGGADSPWVAALIPRGRSLQREAARPEYFRFPRIVVALDQDSRLPLLTKNRLFLGYQEKANSIEIVSYNETAGRFEFQVVDNYGAGLEPRVRYASRDLCTSCHQNLSPIFARPRWRESNFNNDVANLIARHHEAYHGVTALADKGDAARFDFSTDQAGLFNAYQQVWQEGCELGGDVEIDRACRAGLFLAVIQQAIASIPRPRYRSALIEKNLLPPLRANWQRRWPNGMPVFSADIADRESPGVDEVDRVSSQQDPLSRRPMLASWSYKPALRRSIQGIGEQFILLQDLVRLNAALRRKAAQGELPRERLDGGCRLQYTPANEQGRWINVDCRFSHREHSGISIEGELWQASYDDENTARGKLLLTGTAGWARVEINGKLLKHGDNQLRFDFGASTQTRAPRLWDNRIVSRLDVTLPEGDWDDNSRLRAELELHDDLSLVEQAVYDMLEEANSGRLKLFDKQPIAGVELMQALLRKLGAGNFRLSAAPQPVGLELNATSAQTAGATMVEALPLDSPLRLAFKHCAACHSAAARMPPGFLQGDIASIEAQLRQCAPRIALRLAMWQQHADERQKSPMPPPTAFNGNAEIWSDSSEYRDLTQYIERLLPAGAAKPEAEDYDLLPRCLQGQS